MKKATVSMAVVVALGLSMAGFANTQKNQHHGKARAAQKHSQVKVADSTAASSDANAQSSTQQNGAQEANENQSQQAQGQDQAQAQAQSDANQQSASNAGAASAPGTPGNPDYQEND